MFNELFKAFEAEGEELFYVGGFVRDYLSTPDEMVGFAHAVEWLWEAVSRGEKDVDFATSATPEKTIQILKKAGLRVIPIGIEFGTIQTLISGVKVEITTYRCGESYKKGSRKPSVVFGKSIEEDLARRDFTINALAMTKDFKIIDPFGGQEDLKNLTLRTPIDAKTSFGDDPLRMLRGARFVSRFGMIVSDFTFEGMCEMAQEMKNISAERIFDEMSKVLMTPDPTPALQLMADTGLLKVVFPELQKVVDFQQNQGKWHSKLVWPHTLEVVRQSPQILEVRWAALFHDVAKPQTYSETETGVHFYGHDWKGAQVWDQVALRLRVSKEFREHVYFLVYEHLQPSLLSSEGVNNTSDKALRRLMVRAQDKLENLFHLSLADITSHKPEIVAEKKANCLAMLERCRKLSQEQQVERIKLPSGTGTLVAEALGLKPGRELGQVMKKLEQKLIDGEITLDVNFAEEAMKIHKEC